jgi:hypothetical protein
MPVLMERDCGLEDTMEPTDTLDDQLYRDDVLAARVMTPEEKLLAGPQLFDFACRIALDGIRNQFPDVDEQRIRQILAERVELGRRLENAR